jgi:hypothetical protein
LPSETVASAVAATAEEDEEEGSRFGSDPTTTAIATVGVILPLPADTVILATRAPLTTMAPTLAPVDNAAADDNTVAWSATSPTAATSGGSGFGSDPTTTAIAPVDNAAADDNTVAWSTAATSGTDNEVNVDDNHDKGASSTSSQHKRTMPTKKKGGNGSRTRDGKNNKTPIPSAGV